MSDRTRQRLRLLSYAAALIGVLACAKDEPALPAVADDTSRVAAPPLAPYVVADLSTLALGRIEGTIRLGDGVSSDTGPPPFADFACGNKFVDTTRAGETDGVDGIVVWLADARTGKPLSLSRRYTITNVDCRFLPRVQAALVGGTVNIGNRDPISHVTRIVDPAVGVHRAVVHQSLAGQVVPVEQVLAHAGVLDVKCDEHPWMRGWIHVFDHPYFDVTDRTGSFAIDSIPAGDYRLMVWREGSGEASRSVSVKGGGVTTLPLVVRPSGVVLDEPLPPPPTSSPPPKTGR